MNSDSPDPRLPKKQRRRDEDPLDSEMECDALYNQRPLLSYKDIVAGGNGSSPVDNNLGFDDDDIELLDDDIAIGNSNGIPSIFSSERVQQLEIKSMDMALVVKVLVRRINYSVFQNRIFNIWKPFHPLKVMDIENNFFLVKFSDRLDYLKVLTQVDQNITPAINPLFEPTGAAQVTLPLPIIHEFNLDSSSNVTNPTVANPVINVESNSADDVDPSIRGKSKMRGKSTLTMKKGSGALVGSKKGVVVAAKSLKSHLPTPVILMQGPRSFSRNDASSSSIKQNLSKSIVLDPVKHQAVKHLESANSPIPLPVLTGSQHISDQSTMVE
ncbi:hypothetical protein V6N11_068438 [Hibiscus sabdariffa]|uniref:DUF4283 domain-containing protein n=2 Tax=Hibiscus sabdariffa TaxID=183260 RepID=A0ABR2A6T1_9ROSI